MAEVVGWAARLKSAYDPLSRMSFIIQYVAYQFLHIFASFTSDTFRTSILVLAPTPLVAALFMGFARVVRRLGSQYSRLRSTWCESTSVNIACPWLTTVLDSRFFLTADIFSLLIQGGGGGIAAQGASDPNKARLVSL